MAWTAPMTAVLNAVFTASQFNTHIRDNILETEVALATTPGSMFWSTASNAFDERLAKRDALGSSTTTSTTYADLAAGAGPTVTVNTGTQALVFWACRTAKDGVNSEAHVSFAVSGATTIAATDTNALRQDGIIANDTPRFGMFFFQTGLVEGDNIFTLKYRVSSGTGTFSDRQLFVQPI